MNNDAHLIYEAYQASTDQEYTKNNLGVHQLANKANIRVMLQYVEDELGGSGADKFKKESLIYFLNQLLRNADKVADAMKQVEAKMGDNERVPVAARGEEASEEDAEDPKDPEDSDSEEETDDEREEREREEEQDDKEERELRRRSNNSADRYGGGG